MLRLILCLLGLLTGLLGCAAAGPAPQAGLLPLLRGALPPLPPYTDETGRSGSQLLGLPGVQLSGTQFSQAGGNYAPAAGGLLLGGGGRGAQVSFALYSLPDGGLESEMISLDLEAQPAIAGYPAWIGVSNYALGRWQWQDPALDSFSIGPVHRSASGKVHVLVVPTGTADGHPAEHDLLIRSLWRGGTDARVGLPVGGTVLEVGPGKPYASIEAAYADAPSSGGALIYVHAQAGNAAYLQPALQVYKPGIVFWGLGAPAGQRVRLDGSGYNYTGAGSVPRAVFQFNPGADGGVVRGFEIYEAHNDSFNGAAVRINQASHVQVLDCEVHDCDMGMMSNGDASAVPPSAADQLIEGCIFRNCGNLSDPGYNHNLYLGGTSVLMRGCEVYGSLTGHNYKSRAHFNLLIGCYIHDSANRELDLVDDATNTALLGSDTYLVGCTIAKDPACAGNRGVIHFGQDGGNPHNGTLHLLHCTLATPFISNVVTLSAPGALADLNNCLFWDMASGQMNQVVAGVAGGGVLSNVTGQGNWLTAGFQLPPGMLAGDNTLAGSGEQPAFTDAASGDYRLSAALPGYAGGVGLDVTLAAIAVPGRVMQPGDLLWYAFALPRAVPGSVNLMPRSFLGLPDAGAYEFLP